MNETRVDLWDDSYIVIEEVEYDFGHDVEGIDLYLSVHDMVTGCECRLTAGESEIEALANALLAAIKSKREREDEIDRDKDEWYASLRRERSGEEDELTEQEA